VATFEPAVRRGTQGLTAKEVDVPNPGDEFPVDESIGSANPADFDGLMLPGGVANPDDLRMNPEAVRFVGEFFSRQKPVAAICHAPWTSRKPADLPAFCAKMVEEFAEGEHSGQASGAAAAKS
jgi:protease I